jgi:hypothetical protein
MLIFYSLEWILITEKWHLFKELLSQGLRAMQAALGLRKFPMLSPVLMS